MTYRRRASLALLSLTATTLALGADSITLIGTGTVPGSASDLSGISGNICNALTPSDCAPHNRLGAFGSGITFTGHANIYLAVNDRGFFDGRTTVDYLNRFQVLRITVDRDARKVTPTLLDTGLFTNEAGQNLVGQSSRFDTGTRFDPEGVRLANDGTLYVSDEYGPYIYHFGTDGKIRNRITVPAKFLIANPNAVGDFELPALSPFTSFPLPGNNSGRQSNRGMEGLAISPDGKTLFGIMQNALIQDGALNSSNSRRGVHNRILKVDLETGATKEYVYQLTSRSYGVNELLAINDHEFLAIERDGTDNLFKSIYHIDLTGATDVSDVASLPQLAADLPATITPVSKSLFLNLLDFLNPVPEKIEGLTWGPDLDNGSHLLLVTSDNDLVEANPTYIWAFEVPASLVPGFKTQKIQPVWTPGQMKKNQ